MNTSAGTARGWALLIAVGIAIAIVVPGSEWLQICFIPASYADSDYELHWAAAEALERGLDPYDPKVVASFGALTGRPITPFCAAHPLMVRLFSLTGAADAAHLADGYRVALAINGALLLLSALLLAAALRHAMRPGAAPDADSPGSGAATGPAVSAPAALAVAAAMLAFNDGTWMALHYNQLNFVALAGVCGALLAAQRGAWRTEGVLLALAALAKMSPALLIVVAALAGRWRTVRAAALTAVVLGMLSLAWNGWPAHASWMAMAGRELSYAAELRPGLFNNSHHAWNLAPNGAFSRAGDAAGWSAAAVRAATWGVTAAVLAALVVAVRRTRATRTPSEPGAHVCDGVVFAQYALGVCATFLVSSVTWSPHLSLAALPAVWLVCAGWSGAARRAPAALLAGGVAYAVLCMPLGTFGALNDQGLDIQLKLAGCVLLFAVVWTLAGEDETAPHDPRVTPAGNAA